MGSKLSVDEVLSNLERRADFHREQGALHAGQAAHHREQQALHDAELEKVMQSLEAFRGVAASAVDLAQAAPPLDSPLAPAVDPAMLPHPGRKMVARLKMVLESPELQEPFGATAVAAEANRRFAERLSKPVEARTASDVLRRVAAEGGIELVREGIPLPRGAV